MVLLISLSGHSSYEFQIEKLAMLSAKEAKQLCYNLIENGFVTIKVNILYWRHILDKYVVYGNQISEKFFSTWEKLMILTPRKRFIFIT